HTSPVGARPGRCYMSCSHRRCVPLAGFMHRRAGVMDGILTLVGFGPNGWGDENASGVLVSVSLALATVPFGLALGFAIALAKLSGDRYLKLSADIFTTIFRGLPEL